jgi:hypothetical protein
MIIKFEACFGRIKKIEVIRETDKMIIINTSNGERRQKKDSTWSPIFDTYMEARNNIINKAITEVHDAEARLQYRKDELLELLKLPEVESCQNH